MVWTVRTVGKLWTVRTVRTVEKVWTVRTVKTVGTCGRFGR